METPKVDGLTSEPLIVFDYMENHFIMYYHVNGHFYTYANLGSSNHFEFKEVFKWFYLSEIANNLLEYEKLQNS